MLRFLRKRVASRVWLEALLLSLMVSDPGHAQMLTETSELIHTWRGDNGNAFYFDGSRMVQLADVPGLDDVGQAPTMISTVAGDSDGVPECAATQGLKFNRLQDPVESGNWRSYRAIRSFG